MDNYDVVIIGAGQAGPSLAHALANAGKRTALVERKHLGGSCVNFGCTPTKAAITSARLAHLARRGARIRTAHPFGGGRLCRRDPARPCDRRDAALRAGAMVCRE